MASRDFSPFSAALNPFRVLDRQIDRMFDAGFGAAAAGAAGSASGVPAQDEAEASPPSLFLRVVGITSRLNNG